MNAASISRQALVLLPLMMAVAAGCNKQKRAEEPEPDTTQEVKEAGKAVGEEVEEAAEDTGDAVEGAVDEAGDEVQNEPE